jgi:hypothetical protein
MTITTGWQADAGVARRALDDSPARPQPPAGARLLDDPKRGAVLDRLSGVQELGLAIDVAAGRLRRRPQAKQRCGADQGEDVGRGDGWEDRRCHPGKAYRFLARTEGLAAGQDAESARRAWPSLFAASPSTAAPLATHGRTTAGRSKPVKKAETRMDATPKPETHLVQNASSASVVEGRSIIH